jgi:glycosyltransferase involved in cell wall biosynthesis
MPGAQAPSRPAGRLVLVSGRHPFERAGGHESFVAAHAATARLAGYDPHIFAVGNRSAQIDTPIGTLHVVGTPIRPIRSHTAILQRPWMARRIAREIGDAPGPHVVHAFGAWVDTAVAVSRMLGRRGVEAVPIATSWVTIGHETIAKGGSDVVHGSRGLALRHRLELAIAMHSTRRVESRGYHACREVIVNYESVRELLREEYGLGETIRRTTYAPPTAFADGPETWNAPLPAPLAGLGDPAEPLIVSVSRHDGRKGLDVLIRALARLRDAGVPFRACLTGTGLLWESHRALVSSLRLGDRVLLPGRVPEVMPYLRHADVYVLPSIEEGSGSVAVLEALQAGTAVVSTDVDGMPEDITDDVDGVLVPPSDPAALANALTALIRDPARRARLGAAGRALYERRFSPEAAAKDLLEVYSKAGLDPA